MDTNDFLSYLKSVSSSFIGFIIIFFQCMILFSIEYVISNNYSQYYIFEFTTLPSILVRNSKTWNYMVNQYRTDLMDKLYLATFSRTDHNFCEFFLFSIENKLQNIMNIINMISWKFGHDERSYILLSSRLSSWYIYICSFIFMSIKDDVKQVNMLIFDEKKKSKLSRS